MICPEAKSRRRSWLYVPASKREWFSGLSSCNADVIVMDLEDGVPEGHKNSARAALEQEIANNPGFRNKELFIRINPDDTPHHLLDIEAALNLVPHLSGIILPKVVSAQGVLNLEVHLDKTPLEIVPTLELLRSEANAKEIIDSSARIRHIQWGENGDYSLDFGRFDPRLDAMKDPIATDFAAGMVKLAKLSKKKILDGLSMLVNKTEEFEKRCRWAVSMGFDGKGALHPSQVDPINQSFFISPEMLENAAEIVRIYEKSKQGNSFVNYRGSYITPPRYKSAKELLEGNKEAAHEKKKTKKSR